MSKKYDFIIAGSGLAGLSLAYRIRKDPRLDHLSLLLVDKANKTSNDRTWCFWSRTKDYFDHLIYHSWPTICFADHNFTRSYNIDPYVYKMIRGIDFYRHVTSFLEDSKNTEFHFGNIESVEADHQRAELKTTGQSFESSYIFKSYISKTDFSGSHFVWQHFKGWIIECANAHFDPAQATFMDFRLPQADETRFFYVLPFSETKALVELAIFSDEIPMSSYYDPFLRDYIHTQLGINGYKIIEEEIGAIPMTDFEFDIKDTHGRIINIGSNAGQIKGSSGYAFTRIQREMAELYRCIAAGTPEAYKSRKSRYNFYDKVFLNAILSGKTSGEKVFGDMFKKLKPQQIFRFLDEEGPFLNDLRIFSAPPAWPFIKAFFEELKK